MVNSKIPEHPFVRNKEFGNTVLGSVVIAHAIARDLLRAVDLERTARFSSQPFLWRAFSQKVSSAQIDGRYVGYILNSLWNDPIQSNRRVVIVSLNKREATISIFHNKQLSLMFNTTMPITFYARRLEIAALILRGMLSYSGTVRLPLRPFTSVVLRKLFVPQQKFLRLRLDWKVRFFLKPKQFPHLRNFRYP